jgi:two-component system response regulator YesN
VVDDPASLPAIEAAGVDLARIRQLGAEFRTSTGLPLLLVDSTGRDLWSLSGCPLRGKLARSRKMEAACRDRHRVVTEESFRWGEPYISVCPFGLVTFAVPISQERRLKAGLVSGFSVFPQMEKDIHEDVLRSLAERGIGFRLGPRTKLRFRVVPSETLRRNADFLFELTGSMGVNDLELINESREKSIQQVTIANYLADARAGKQDLVAQLVRMQNEIIDKVVLGDLAGSREIINRFLGVIFLESGMNFDVLKVRLLELIIIISRAAIEKGINAEGLLGPRYSFLTDINAAVGFNDLFWKVTKALENFSGTISEQKGRKTRVHVTRMKDYVKKNFTSKISAREVAATAGVSVSRALHLFREESGMPLSGYIARERIEYAKYLMDNTDDSMATIASECGFFDQSHFTKTFNALEHMPPSRYKRKARGG